MDELGSYPRIRFEHHNQYTHDADQNGSWLGLAISGLKFLMTPTPTASTTPNNPSSATTHRFSSKPHILGPSSYRNQLYDIEEEEEGHAPKMPSRLTHKTLQQFNGNFSNYWNQRSSLHSEHTLSDGGGSSSTLHDLDARPSMTSSQIIHPTQSTKAPTLQHSASFPLLHSAEYRHSLEHFALSNPSAPSRESNEDAEGSTTSIPSPPAISATPELGSGSMFLESLKNVQPLRSWGSAQSDRHSVRSVDRESVRSNQSNRSDIVFVGVSERKRNVSGGSSGRSGSTLVHIHNGSKEPSEVGCEESASAMTVIEKRAEAAEDENVFFSDWSNVSSVVQEKEATKQ